MTDTPTLSRPQFHVWMNPPASGERVAGEPLSGQPEPEYVGVVTITHGDQLRAELEGPRHGLHSMKDAPMHYTTLWVWAAMVRSGTYAGKFGQFKADDLADLSPVKDDQVQEDGDDADPTNPDSSIG